MNIIGLILLPIVVSVENFGYNPQNGPSTRTGTCATGNSQSPVNIHIGKLVHQNFGPLIFENYDASGVVDVENNGHTAEIIGFLNWTRVPTVRGGGLGATYRLQQFHFHWNGDDWSGSEHTLMGIHAPLEAHLVHIRSDLTADTASTVPGGIAVVSVLFTVALNPEDAITDLDEVFYETVDPVIRYSPGPLIPMDTNHFLRYNGSLTTPPCAEVVTWTILAQPLHVEEQQLNLLRNHVADDGGLLRKNWRNTQPLNGRTVIISGGNQLSAARQQLGIPILRALKQGCVYESELDILQARQSGVVSGYRPECLAALRLALELINV